MRKVVGPLLSTQPMSVWVTCQKWDPTELLRKDNCSSNTVKRQQAKHKGWNSTTGHLNGPEESQENREKENNPKKKAVAPESYIPLFREEWDPVRASLRESPWFFSQTLVHASPVLSLFLWLPFFL